MYKQRHKVTIWQVTLNQPEYINPIWDIHKSGDKMYLYNAGRGTRLFNAQNSSLQ